MQHSEEPSSNKSASQIGLESAFVVIGIQVQNDSTKNGHSTLAYLGCFLPCGAFYILSKSEFRANITLQDPLMSNKFEITV